MVRLRPVWMTNHPPSVLWQCWLGHQACKNRRPYNLYCVGADVKPCSINQSGGDGSQRTAGWITPRHRLRCANDVDQWCVIVELTLEEMVASGQLDGSHHGTVYDVLMTRHRHQHERKEGTKGLPVIRSLAEIGHRNSEKKLENKGNWLYC